MALADPISITLGADTFAFARTGFGDGSSSFQTLDGKLKLSVLHTSKRRVRHSIRLENSEIVSDPLVSGLNVPVKASVTLIIDAPQNGFENEQLVGLVQMLSGILALGSGATVLEPLVGNQS